MSETESMERIVVSGTALKDKLAMVSLRGVPNKPGVVAKIFHTIATHSIVVDDIIQTVDKGKATEAVKEQDVQKGYESVDQTKATESVDTDKAMDALMK